MSIMHRGSDSGGDNWPNARDGGQTSGSFVFLYACQNIAIKAFDPDGESIDLLDHFQESLTRNFGNIAILWIANLTCP